MRFLLHTIVVNLILISLFVIFTSNAFASGEAYLSYLSNNGAWKNWKPDNFELVAKRGEGAFFWSSDAEPENIPDSKVKTRQPFLFLKPNIFVDVERKTMTGMQIYKTRYTTDEKSRRLIINKIQEGDSKRNAIFLGCSFTWGTGVADDETFPYYFSRYRENFNVYNLGIYSAGANDILDDLRNFERLNDISKNGGVVLYTALNDHIERSVCSYNCYSKSYRDWILKKSNYQYDPQNQVLINRGSFEESRPVSNMIFGLLTKIGLVDSITIPFKLSDQQIELYVMMVAEMKKTAKDKFNAEFYYTMYPGHYENWDRIKPLLRKYGIKFLDLSKIDFEKATNKRHKIILDGHPTKLSNYLYASLLHHQLPK